MTPPSQPATVAVWTDLFASPVPPDVLANMLAHGAVPLDPRPEIPTALLQAFLRRERPSESKNQQHERLFFKGQPVPALDTWPRDFDGYAWPTPDATGPGNLWEDLIIGRLLAAGAAPQADTPTAILTLALEHHWTATAGYLLTHPDRPSTAELEGLRSSLSLQDERKPLPWLHTLARQQRLNDMTTWLSVDGMDANALDHKGRNALFFARDPDTVALLITKGAQPLCSDHDGQTCQVMWKRSYGLIAPTNVGPMLLALNSTLNPTSPQALTHHLCDWAKTGPLSWETMDEETRAAMGRHRVQTQIQNEPITWGPIGFLGINLKNFVAHDEMVNGMRSWADFVDSVPAAWLTHESLPGVQDGWILAVTLSTKSGVVSASPGTQSLHQALRRLEAHLLQDEPASSRSETGLKAMMAAVDGMIACKPSEAWLVGQAITRLTQTSYCIERDGFLASGIEEDVSPNPPYSLNGQAWENILIEGLNRPHIRPLILKNGTLLNLNAGRFDQWHRDAEQTNQLWRNLLAAHSEYRKESTGLVSNQTLSQIRAVESTMEILVRAGHLPTGFSKRETTKTRKAMTSLPPTVASALQLVLIGQAIAEAPAAGKRPRL